MGREVTSLEFRTARIARGMTQAKAAAYLGTARNTVSRYERGERPIPPLVAIRMAGPPDELVEAVARSIAVADAKPGQSPLLLTSEKYMSVTRKLARAAITRTLDYVAKLDANELPERFLS